MSDNLGRGAGSTPERRGQDSQKGHFFQKKGTSRCPIQRATFAPPAPRFRRPCIWVPFNFSHCRKNWAVISHFMQLKKYPRAGVGSSLPDARRCHMRHLPASSHIYVSDSFPYVSVLYFVPRHRHNNEIAYTAKSPSVSGSM